MTAMSEVQLLQEHRFPQISGMRAASRRRYCVPVYGAERWNICCFGGDGVGACPNNSSE